MTQVKSHLPLDTVRLEFQLRVCAVFLLLQQVLWIQLELITRQSMKAGFTGGLVVDFPNSTKAKKYVSATFERTTNLRIIINNNLFILQFLVGYYDGISNKGIL